MVEELLGLSLAKEHSAVDWSTRPLPESWLRYAALDVEVLVDLRDALAHLLERQGKLAWAEQEFAAIVAAPPAPPRVDPWRRTSGVHRLRSRRQLGLVRELGPRPGRRPQAGGGGRAVAAPRRAGPKGGPVPRAGPPGPRRRRGRRCRSPH